jgi:dihydrolipoamide dehydrogenase
VRHPLSLLPAFGIHGDAGKVDDGRAVMRRVREERHRFVGFVLDAAGARKQSNTSNTGKGWHEASPLSLQP